MQEDSDNSDSVGNVTPQADEVVVDGLLCNIIKALSPCSNDSELIAAVERQVSEVEVKESWWKFFNYFDCAIDDTRKIKVII